VSLCPLLDSILKQTPSTWDRPSSVVGRSLGDCRRAKAVCRVLSWTSWSLDLSTFESMAIAASTPSGEMASL
jgi:hypothetical protein